MKLALMSWAEGPALDLRQVRKASSESVADLPAPALLHWARRHRTSRKASGDALCSSMWQARPARSANDAEAPRIAQSAASTGVSWAEGRDRGRRIEDPSRPPVS